MPRHLIATLGLGTAAAPALRRVSEGGAWRVLLYNDQVHTFSEVIALLVVATGFDLERCSAITLEVHVAGRAEVVRTGAAEAERIVGILCDGGLLAAMRQA